MRFEEQENRICLLSPEGKTLAEVTFAPGKDGLELDHTFVDPSLAGQGIAGKLMEAAVDRLRRERRKAKISCSYAVYWFEKHPEYRDVVAE